MAEKKDEAAAAEAQRLADEAAAAEAQRLADEAAAAEAAAQVGKLSVKLTSVYGDNGPGDIVTVDEEEARRIVMVGGGVPASDEEAAE